MTNLYFTWVSPSALVWWVLTDEALAQSNLSAHPGSRQGLTNTGPIAREQNRHTERDTVVPKTCFPLSQMEQTFHMQLQASETKRDNKVAVGFFVSVFNIIVAWCATVCHILIRNQTLFYKKHLLICLHNTKHMWALLTFGACWILGFCRNRVISAFSALRRWKRIQFGQYTSQ